MEFTETLFGGVLVIIVLYFTARRFALSNYWSSWLSGALPFLAYLGYSMSHDFTEDILAIHCAVFMATAGVLGMLGGVRQRKKEKMHWAPKLLIAFFIMLAILNATLLSIAMHGVPDVVSNFLLPKNSDRTVHTAFPGVVPHDRNKLYEPYQKQVQLQRELGWNVTLINIDNLQQNITHTMLLKVSDKNNQPVSGAKVNLTMWRMANSKDDQRFELNENQAGEYQAKVTMTNAGNWIADINIVRGQDTYIMQQPVIVAE